VAWSLVRVVGGAGGTGPAPVGAEPGQVYVQFVIAAPGARSVALAGDFSEWSPSIELSDADLDGVWSARVALEPGVHEYMFVIDGSEWRPDPNSLSYTDDGFGQRNSVLAVSALDET
jgi:1,4-alpha-glucan branching enzyme